MSEAICETSLPGQAPAARGKVRDIYDLGDRLLIVATAMTFALVTLSLEPVINPRLRTMR